MSVSSRHGFVVSVGILLAAAGCGGTQAGTADSGHPGADAGTSASPDSGSTPGGGDAGSSGADAGSPGGDAGISGGNIGTTCAQDTDCSQGPNPACLTSSDDFPGGYCTSVCTTNTDCGATDPCVANTGFTNPTGTPISLCLQACASNADCRTGYYCLSFEGSSFCWNDCTNDNDCIGVGQTCDTSTGLCSSGQSSSTDAGTTTPEDAGMMTTPPPDAGSVAPPATGTTGAPCTSSRRNCANAGPQPQCLTSGEDWPDGYCTSTCTTDSDCGAGNICETGAFQDNSGNDVPQCLHTCNSNADCRSGYNCLTYMGQNFCFLDCQSSADCIDTSQTCDTSTGLCTGEMLATGPSEYDAGPMQEADAGHVVPTPDAGSPPPPSDAGPFVTIPLTGCAFVGYDAPVTIDTQMFQMSIDTGSTTTAVAASSCRNCDVSPTYSPPSSADTGQTTSSQYGSGSWSGDVYSDTVQVGAEMPAVTMDFAGITSQSQFFIPYLCDGSSGTSSEGILGLGPLSLDTIGMSSTDAYFSDLVATARIGNLFAVQLCALGGNLWFGGYDTSYVTSAPQYTPIVGNEYYSVTLSDVGFNGTSLGYSASDYGQSVVDTGTWGLLLPTAAYNKLVKDIAADAAVTTAFGSNTITADFFQSGNCVSPTGAQTPADLNSSLPPLYMTFPGTSGGSFTLSFPAATSYLIPSTSGGQTQYCGGIGSSSSIGGTIIGAAALASYVIVFDPANTQIGFASGTGCP